MPPVIRTLFAPFCKIDKLVAEINECSIFAFAMELKIEKSPVKLQSFFDIAHLESYVIDTNCFRFFRHLTSANSICPEMLV